MSIFNFKKKNDARQQKMETYGTNKYWTPKLKENTDWNPAANTPVGEFSPAEKTNDALSNLANALSCEGNYTFNEISSIPDVWAQPLFFQQMLFNDQKDEVLEQASKDAELQWRAMLCVAAMSGSLLSQYNIDTVTVHLAHTTNEMLGVLNKLPPKNAQIWADFGWDKVRIIKTDDDYQNAIPLVICHPGTLVCPAADCWNFFAQAKLPFFYYDMQKGGYVLADPVQKLSGENASFMKTWLRWMIQQLEKDAAMGRTVIDAALKTSLLNKLMAFERSISAPAMRADSMGSIPLNATYADYILFARIQTPLDPQELVIGQNAQGAPMILVDAPISNPSFETKLFRNAYQADPGKAMLRLPPNSSVRRQQDLFLDQVCVIRPYSGETPGISGAVKSPAADERELVVMLPIAEDCAGLANSVSVQVRYEDYELRVIDSITVKWDISIAGIRSCPITNEYLMKSGQIREFDFAGLNTTALWPCRELEGWRDYFLFNDVGEIGGPAQYIVRPLKADMSSPGTQVQRSSGTMDYFQLNNYPKVLCCESNKVFVGMIPILADGRTITAQNTGIFTVSMDFGTSSSVIYCREDQQIARPLDLRESVTVVSRLTPSPTGPVENDPHYLVTRLFMPAGAQENIQVPFPTLYLDHDNGKESLFHDGHIYFKKNDPMMQNPPTEAGTLLSNTKWGGKSEHVIYQMALMACLQARLAGYRNVNWRVSYPVSMSNSRAYLAKYRETCLRAMEAAGVTIPDENAQGTVFSDMTESEAAARYFAGTSGFNVDKDNIAVVDIGGGSSDLFLYTLRGDVGEAYEGSIRLGARDLLLDLLRKRPDFLRQLLKAVKAIRGNESTDGLSGETVERLLKEHDNGDPSFFNQEIESFFSYPLKNIQPGVGANGTIALGVKLAAYIASGYATDNKISDRLRQDIMLFKTILAANILPVFYYSGLLIRHVNETRGGCVALPHVGVAGNGSNMLRWLGPEEQANSLIYNIIKSAAGIEGEAENIVFSKALKHEAASGMTKSPIAVTRGNVTTQPLLICGEAVTYLEGDTSVSVGAMDQLNSTMLKKRMLLDPILGTAQFANMLTRYNFCANTRDSHNTRMFDLFSLDIKDAVVGDVAVEEYENRICISRSKLIEKVNRSLLDYHQDFKKESSKTDERPVFITVAKVVREMLNSTWESRGY